MCRSEAEIPLATSLEEGLKSTQVAGAKTRDTVLTFILVWRNVWTTSIVFFMNARFVAVVRAYPLEVVLIVLKSLASRVILIGLRTTLCRLRLVLVPFPTSTSSIS